MGAILNTDAALNFDLYSEKTWEHLIKYIRTYARHWIYSSHLPYWKEIEEDIVDDIVQETVYRCSKYFKRVELGEALPIYSLKRMAVTIAHHYYIDLLRRDKRLKRGTSDDVLYETPSTGNTQVSAFELAIEHISQKELFTYVAQEIAYFPAKQRQALLNDLANRMQFGPELTPLQEAFVAAGINLQAYQQPISLDPKVRSRQAALRSIAYKRLAYRMRPYIMETMVTDDINMPSVLSTEHASST